MHESWHDYKILDHPAILNFIFYPRADDYELPDTERSTGFLAPVGDGISISCRFFFGNKKNANVLFFHGNGEIVADYAELAKVYTRMGINFMPIDYRGYGRSSGSPTVTTMLKDAQQAFCFARQWLRDHGYAGRFVVTRKRLAT